MNNDIKVKLLFAALMAFVTSSMISFIIVSVNVGFVDGFFWLWGKSFAMAYFLVIFAILVVSPKVQTLSEKIIGLK